MDYRKDTAYVVGGGDNPQYYTDILRALTQSGASFPANKNAIMKEASMVGSGIL